MPTSRKVPAGGRTTQPRRLWGPPPGPTGPAIPRIVPPHGPCKLTQLHGTPEAATSTTLATTPLPSAAPALHSAVEHADDRDGTTPPPQLAPLIPATPRPPGPRPPPIPANSRPPRTADRTPDHAVLGAWQC